MSLIKTIIVVAALSSVLILLVFSRKQCKPQPLHSISYEDDLDTRIENLEHEKSRLERFIKDNTPEKKDEEIVETVIEESTSELPPIDEFTSALHVAEKYDTIPNKVELPSLYLPYKQGEIGYCDGWRAGNRSAINLANMKQQVSTEKIFGSIHGIVAGYGAQSLYYCSAAKRLGWKEAHLGKYPNGPTSRMFKELVSQDVSLVCGGDIWFGWKNPSKIKALDESKVSSLEHRWENPLDPLSKLEQFEQVRAASKQVGCDYAEQGFFSESYDFANTDDCMEFFKRSENNPKYTDHVWVSKSNGHKAGGVSMLTYDKVKELYGGCKHSQPFLVQRFMQDIFLLDNRKWDARVYVLVASFDPLIVYSFDLFHIRASLTKYVDPLPFLKKSGGTVGKKQSKTPEGKELSGSLLTNAAVQLKENPLSKYDEHMWSPEKFAEYISKAGLDPVEFNDTIFKRMQSVIEFIFHTTGEWSKHPGRFRIYGFDFMVDKDLKPVLIDINSTPGFPGKNRYAKELVKTLFEEATTLIHELHAGKGLNEDRAPSTQHFHLTYHQDEHASTYWKN